MKKTFVAALCALAPSIAIAQGSPIGLWKTIDDKTGKERSLVRISEGSGALVDRIEKRLDPAARAPTARPGPAGRSSTPRTARCTDCA